MNIIVVGIIILCVWYFFFYEPPSEIDKFVNNLNADFQEGFGIISASTPDTDDIKKFYKRATDLSNNLAYAEKTIAEMNNNINQKQFDVASGYASKILEANRKRVELASLTQTIQQSYLENTAALNKLMDDYKAYVGSNNEKLKEMAEKSIPNYLLRNNYVNGIEEVRNGLGEIHTNIRNFLEKSGIIVAPLEPGLLKKLNM
jgi:hypothetical protein